MNGKKFIAILWVLLLLSAAVYAQSNDDVLSARVDDAVRAQMQEQNTRRRIAECEPFGSV
jgi:hypothetical protein